MNITCGEYSTDDLRPTLLTWRRLLVRERELAYAPCPILNDSREISCDGGCRVFKQVETTYSAYQPVGVSPGSSGRFASGGGKPGLTPIGSLSFTERIFHTCLTGTNQQAARLLIGGDADWK